MEGYDNDTIDFCTLGMFIIGTCFFPSCNLYWM